MKPASEPTACTSRTKREKLKSHRRLRAVANSNHDYCGLTPAKTPIPSAIGDVRLRVDITCCYNWVGWWLVVSGKWLVVSRRLSRSALGRLSLRSRFRREFLTHDKSTTNN